VNSFTIRGNPNLGTNLSKKTNSLEVVAFQLTHFIEALDCESH
jgi:hypothetical protein